MRVKRSLEWGIMLGDKLQDTGGRENHGCNGLIASRKLPAYGRPKRSSTR
jgi:hypothetical protein